MMTMKTTTREREKEVIGALKIFNKLKPLFILMMIVCCASVACVSSSLAANPSEVSGTTRMNAQKPLPKLQLNSTKSNSSVFRKNPPKGKGASLLDRELRKVKRALEKSQDRLLGGATISLFSPVLGGLYVAAPLVGYVSSHVGDALNDVFEGADSLLSNVDKIENGFLRWGAKAILSPIKAAVVIGGAISGIVFGRSNADCNIERMEGIYRSGCYACAVVKSLIGSFMTASSTMFTVSQSAANKILPLGLLLWIAFFAIKQVSSFKNIEPSAIVQELLVMAFKVILAFIIINSAVSFFVDYMIAPFLTMGAEFGVNLMAVAGASNGIDYTAIKLDQSYMLDQQEVESVIDVGVLNIIMTYVAAADSVTSTHLMLGHMVTCHSTRAGAISIIAIAGYIPDFWLWVCGAGIWVAGFMMTLSIAYYLIDVSFKLGFAIIALPIAVSLWPFNVTKGKVTACFQIILKSMGIFIFLAMTTALGLALVSQALDIGMEADRLVEAAESIGGSVENKSGTELMLLAIEEGDAKYVSKAFSLFSGSFLVLLFAYLYAIKIIGSTISDYVNTFFPDGVFGDNNVMHRELTRATDVVKKKLGKAAAWGGKAAKNQASKGLDSMGGGKGILAKLSKFKGRVDNLVDGDTSGKDTDKDKNKSKITQAKQMANLEGKDGKANKSSGEAAGAGIKNAGKALEQSGQAMEKGGEVMEKSGKALKSGGEAIKATGQGISAGGDALNASVVGAPVGVVAKGAGEGTKASGEAVKQTGNIIQKMGKIIKTIGKQMKETGKKMKNAGSKMQSTAKKLKGKVGGTFGKIKKALSGQNKKGGGSPEKNENNNSGSKTSVHDDKGASSSGGDDMMSSVTGLDKGKKK